MQAQRVAERGEPAAASLSREPLNAPLFHALVDRMHDGARWVVLDLGAARSETVRLFGQFRCRLDIASLAENLDALNAEQEPQELKALTEASLPPLRAEATNLVLCWDLLNYLTRPALTAVMEAVAARSARGTLAHALVVYSEPRMPARPSCFVPVDSQRLVNLSAAPAVRAAPRYTPEDLAHCLPRYTVERARLLRNGMQEFLFRL
jgi:hypothetical protein